MIITLTTTGLGLWSVTDRASAAPGAGPFTSAASALANAPQGTPMSNYFTLAQKNTAGSAVSNNSAGVVSATSPVAGMTNNAVRITADTKNQTGAIWSTKESFDLSKNQVASMWIFASGTDPKGKNPKPGDGMAFVLQNAGNTDQFSGAGESLGVWGTDPKTSKSEPQKLANTAIPSSWALEFDTFTNNSVPSTGTDINSVQPSAFELGSAYQTVNSDGTGGGNNLSNLAQHLASNYPGRTNSYEALGTFRGPGFLLYTSYYYYGLAHLGFMPVGSTLANGTWHHVTMNYTAPTTAGANGMMQYTFDDKNPQTGEPQSASYGSRTVPIDLTAFNLKDGQTKIRWGFTGSTGESTESNMVIFDQIPGETKTKATADMTYEKDGQSVSVTSDGKTQIPGGSKVTLNYAAQRLSGDNVWSGLNAEIKVPDYITLNGKATIFYANGSTREATVTKQSDGYANISLATDGSNTGLTLDSTDTVKIAVGGRAQNPTSGNTYSSGSDLTSYFKGTNAVSTAVSPAFTITHQDLPSLGLSLDHDKVNVNAGSDINLSGKLVTTDGSQITNSNMMLNMGITVPGSSLPTTIAPVVLSESNPASGFSFKIATNSLSAGTYTLNITATDTSNPSHVSNTALVTIVVGGVSFGSSSGDLTYQSALSGSTKIIQRSDPNWSFNINDTLIKGSPWHLTAQASKLTTGPNGTGTVLEGELVYGPTNDTMSSAVLVDDHQSDGTNTPFNIASDWDANSGIRLRVNGGALKGSYSGEVDWVLANGPA